ncbi:hypothetical protein J5N97_014519 [Dioscorea zingiberensis]|uniref:Uncharacterized protein n=1 Tax=Dioscorea zingiberensis TaxID=325984 RepID=A0A9D5CVF7_9LILI|nr:hypothetical protein J5N97_014519 [Dioscorea zingiberensis]
MFGVEVEESNETAMLQDERHEQCRASAVFQDTDDSWIQIIDVKAETMDANQARKKTIWLNRKATEFQDRVFENLRPHWNIQEVSITAKSSHLLGSFHPSSISSLKIFVKVKQIGGEFYGNGSVSIVPFPSLETLEFNKLSIWEGLDGVGLNRLASLQSLKIWNCPKGRSKVCDSTQLPVQDGIGSRMHDLVERFDVIELQLNDLNTTMSKVEVEELGIYGRQEDRNRVIELILENRKSELCVIPIVGVQEWCQEYGRNKLVHNPRVIVDQKDFYPNDINEAKHADQPICKTC